MNQKHPSAAPRTELDDLMAEVRASLAPSPPSRARLDVSEIMRRVQDELSRRRAGATVVDDARAPDPAWGEEAACRSRPWRSVMRVDTGKKEFVLDELLAPSDLTFVDAAYRALLRRDPDPAGRRHYASLLRSGATSKVEVLGALRWSPEGCARSVHVDGLLVPYTLQRWQKKPVVGPIIAWVHGLLRLGSLVRRQYQMESATAHEMHGLGGSLDALAQDLEDRIGKAEARHSQQWHALERELAPLPAALREHDQRLVQLASALAEGIGQLVTREKALEESARRLEERIDEVRKTAETERMAARQGIASLDSALEKLSKAQHEVLERLASMKAHIGRLDEFPAAVAAAQQRIDKLSSALPAIEQRLRADGEILQGSIDEIRTALEAGNGQHLRHEARLVAHERQLAEHAGTLGNYGAVLSVMEQLESKERAFVRTLDPLYAAFEGRFRGDASLVRARAEPYVQLVVEAGAGTDSAPVLDLGCGRGEWLALLREKGLVGRGIDSNQVFIETCRGQGLDVIEGDIIEIMRTLPDGSVGAVTGMHIAEHLPFEVLVRLLDEARRLLVPGGLIALETPNPENLRVATEFFYLDPTHRNPLPPEALRWMVEARGFDHARIERLTLARETGAPPLLDDSIPGADSVNVLLSRLDIALDYAVIARRGGP